MDRCRADRSFDSLRLLSVDNVETHEVSSFQCRSLPYFLILLIPIKSPIFASEFQGFRHHDLFTLWKRAFYYASMDCVPSITLLFSSVSTEHFSRSQLSEAAYSIPLDHEVTMLLHKPQAAFCLSAAEVAQQFLFWGTS